ncbi:MAG: hypothetical protein ACK5WS_06335 [Alphaproteobacteria bacterium]|jgi:hypothetical protein|nr:hypothetical protein [Candidatus Jidaibacter sp.]
MSYFEDAYVSFTHYEQTPLISDIFSADYHNLAIDNNSQPMNKASGSFDVINGASDELEYDYYDYLVKEKENVVTSDDVHFYNDAVSKFVSSVIFSNAISLSLWGSSVILNNIGAPSFVTKVLNGMSIGLGKNIVMSSCADDFKSYIASSRLYDVIESVTPEYLSRFINDEIALTSLNILLNGMQDYKTSLLVSLVSQNTAQDLEMKTPDYPERIMKTGFQRVFKDGFLFASEWIDFMPNKAKYFAIDTAKGVCKDLIWTGGQLQFILLKNVSVTTAKYLGEYCYLNFAKDYTDHFIAHYIVEDYHLNYLAGKLASSTLPTAFLTMVNKGYENF